MARRKKQPEIITDPARVAKAADLRYVNGDEPGITRRKAGRGFTYIGPDGERITDEATLERINSLVIPPAYTDVWICLDENGHLQATGRDARGRKQYRYHPRWAQHRGQSKFDRMLLFGQTLPAIRERVRADLGRRGLPREKVLAVVVALMDTTYIRIGNMEYARDNESYGLTTMQDEHVEITGSQLHFEFRGKSGKEQTVDLRDRRLAKLVKRCQDVPGQALFQYYNSDNVHHAIGSADVNNYLRDISGQPFTAKDFRTWGGTKLAVLALTGLEPFETQAQCKSNIVQMVKSVASDLGNTVAVCRKYYIHPAVMDAYRDGVLDDLWAEACGTASDDSLQPEERVVLSLLERQVTKASKR